MTKITEKLCPRRTRVFRNGDIMLPTRIVRGPATSYLSRHAAPF